MTTIWKFPIILTDRQLVPLPACARILTVQMQNGVLCLWAMVDPSEKELRGRTIEILGTGEIVDDSVRAYIGTVQSEGLVWHVFER